MLQLHYIIQQLSYTATTAYDRDIKLPPLYRNGSSIDYEGVPLNPQP